MAIPAPARPYGEPPPFPAVTGYEAPFKQAYRRTLRQMLQAIGRRLDQHLKNQDPT